MEDNSQVHDTLWAESGLSSGLDDTLGKSPDEGASVWNRNGHIACW